MGIRPWSLWVPLLTLGLSLAGCTDSNPQTETWEPPQLDSPEASPRAATSSSTVPRLRFQHLDDLERPGKHNILEVFQDTLGFIWFATDDGLIRYDGRTTRAFGPVPFDTTSLSDPWVSWLEADGSGGMWVATETGGLNRYDPRHESFRHYPDAPARLAAVLSDPGGGLWIATRYDGLMQFDPATGRATLYPLDADGLTTPSDDRIRTLLRDRNGILWIGTSASGLRRLDPVTGTLRTYSTGSKSFPASDVRALHEDERGRLWVGTGGGGVARYDPASDTFVRVPDTGSTGEGRDNVDALFTDPNGILWIGSDAGLDRYDPETGLRTPYRHRPSDPFSIGPGGVTSLFLDRSGVLWVGRTLGVSSFEWAPSPFQHYGHDPDDPNSLNSNDVSVVYVDRDSVLWVGTDVGLNRIDRERGRVTRYAADPSDPGRLATSLVMGIFETNDGAFWVASRGGGLQQFDREAGRVVKRFIEIPGDSTSLFSALPWWVLEDRRGRTWITSGGAGCLSQMHRDTGTFTRLCHDSETPNTPSYDFARYLIEGRDGALWLGTWGGGLDRIDPETGAFTHYRHDPTDRNTPSSDIILFVGEGEDGVLWLGTFGSGFSRFDPVAEAFTHYTSHNSALPSDVVYGIQPDDNGYLWMSTNAGIVRFDPQQEAFRRFGGADGIPGLEFNSGASFRSASGELFFGGVDGLTAFFPDRVASNTVAPPVVLTDVQVNGERMDAPGPEAPTETALPYAREIRLRPHQRDLAIAFAALHFVDPAQNLFRYRLDGYDAAWRTPGPERTATYTNLSPGPYTFRVVAANSDGVWNADGATISVVVMPRWYETKWALGLYALLTIGLLAAAYRVRQNRLRLRHQLEIEHLETQKLRQLDRSKSAFFSNVSHEFRTPLTLTLGPLDDVLAGEQGPISEAARSSLALARRSAGRVLDLINQMLDVARLEAGQTPLRARPLRLGDAVQMQTEAFAALAAQKQIAVELEAPEAPVEVMADPEHLGTILSNLLSNAFKFTPERGTVRVRLETDATTARVVVRDSGPGIPAEDLPRVFDRFYQVRSDRGQRPLGTGIGLALAHELAALHGGALTAESEEGFGSAFTLALSLGDTHLAPEQIADAPAEDAPDRESPARTAPPRLSGDGQDREATLPEPSEDIATILVVEDNADIRALVRRQLERADYRVAEAPDGEAGLEAARRLVPDLILSDVMMPKMDGLALCRALKADPETDFIPVILLTAKAAPEDRLDGLREHADAYLVKPFDPDELLARIEALIAVRTRLRERFRSEGVALVLGEAPAPSPLHARALEAEPAEATFLHLVRETIEAHLGDDGFSVQRLADETNVSRGHLHRQLVALTGQTPTEAIRTMRLERAAQLLAARAGSVSEVAYAVGFKSVSHFSNAFLDFTGSRPSEYPAAG